MIGSDELEQLAFNQVVPLTTLALNGYVLQ